MRSKNSDARILEDLMRMAGGALGALGDAKGQLRAMVKERVDRLIADMDLVTREEFESLEAMVAKARQRQEELEKRLQALDKKPGRKKTATKSKPVAKTKKGKKK